MWGQNRMQALTRNKLSHFIGVMIVMMMMMMMMMMIIVTVMMTILLVTVLCFTVNLVLIRQDFRMCQHQGLELGVLGSYISMMLECSDVFPLIFGLGVLSIDLTLNLTLERV